MNSKLIALMAVLAVCISGVAIVTSESDSSDAADTTFSLSTESATIGAPYSRTLTGPGLLDLKYYTVTGADWLSISGNNLTVAGTPTAAGTYNVTVTGPIVQGNAEAEWKWTINVISGTVYTVTVMNGSQTAYTSTIAAGGTYTLPTYNDSTTKIFKGFYTAPTGGTYVGSSGTKVTVNSNVTYYAQWVDKAATVVVKLDLNGHYIHPNGQLYIEYLSYNKEIGSEFSFSVAANNVNSDYIYVTSTNQKSTDTFLGWATTPTGTPVTYPSFTVSSAVTYYAIWGQEAEELSFLGGTNSVIGVSGDSYSYTPDTNIENAVITYTKTVSWLKFTNGVLSGTVPSVTAPTSYEVTLTATTSNPTQTVTQNISFYVYPALTYINEPVTNMFMGESYDFDLSTYLSGVKYTISGVDWLTVVNGHIVGSAPKADTTYAVSYTVTATHTASGQSDSKTVILYVNEILEFTTLPTSSFVASQVEGNEKYESFILEYLDGLFTSSSAAVGDIDYYFSGSHVKFVFTGTNAEKLKWYVNDKLVSEDWTFEREFDNGDYKISCIAENDLGSSEVYSVNISVEKPFMGLTIIDYAIVLIILLGVLLAVKKIRSHKKEAW